MIKFPMLFGALGILTVFGLMSGIGQRTQQPGDQICQRPAGADALLAKAKLLFSTHDYAGSLAEANQAFALAEDSSCTRFYALALIAQNQDALRQPGPAEQSYRQALEIAERITGPSSRNTALISQGIGLHYLAKHDVYLAEPLLRRALVIFESLRPPHRFGLALAMRDLASAYMDPESNPADRTKATDLLERALPIFRETDGAEGSTTLGAMNNLAVSYMNTGQYAKAEPILLRYQEIVVKQQGPKGPAALFVLDALAATYGGLGQAGKQEMALKKYLAIGEEVQGPDGDFVITGLNNLGAFYYSRNDLAQAEPLFSRAFNMALKKSGSDETAAMLHGWMAEINARKGHYDAALPHALRVAEIYQALHGPDGVETIGAIRKVSAVYLWSRDFPKSVVYARDARERAQRRFNSRRTAAGTPPAEATISKAKTFDEPSRTAGYVEASEAFLKSASYLSQDAGQNDPRLANEMFLAAQSALTNPTALALQAAAARRHAPTDEALEVVRALQDLLRDIAAADSRYSATLSGGSTPDRQQAAKTELNGMVARAEALETRLKSIYPAYSELAFPTPVNIATVQTHLAPDQALFLTIGFAGDRFNFLVTKTAYGFRRIDDGQTRGRDQVKSVLCSVDSKACSGRSLAPEPDYFDFASSLQIYRDTLEPFSGLLDGVKRLYVTTNDELSRMPFNALVTSMPPAPARLQSAHWLDEKFAITNLPSVAAMTLATQDTGAVTVNFIGYGDPALSGPSSPAAINLASLFRGADGLADLTQLKNLEPLPETGIELDRMAGALNARRNSVHKRSDDTEAAFKADGDLARARVVSIATHGLLPANVDTGVSESGLVFTPPSMATNRDDGLLTGSEIVTLDFNADWIILSACNTATADGQGDSFSSLARAFLFAGGKTVLASYWRVDDQVTADLIVNAVSARTHDRHLTSSQALQKAMSAIRGNPKFAHPRFWAGFSLVSNNDGN